MIEWESRRQGGGRTDCYLLPSATHHDSSKLPIRLVQHEGAVDAHQRLRHLKDKGRW